MRYIVIVFLLFAFNTNASSNKKDDFIKAFEEANYQQVIKLAQQSLNNNPRNFNAWYYKGLAEKALYKYASAAESFKHAANLSTDNANLFYLLASSYENSGNTELALSWYKKVLQIDTLHIPALNSLAKVYKHTNSFKEAIETYTKLVNSDSTNGYYYAQLAYCCKKFGFTEPVIFYYEKAISLNENDLESGNNLAIELINQKYYEDANKVLDTFLVKFPDNIRLLKRKAYLAAVEARYLDAIAHFKQVVELGDSSMFTSKYYGQSLFNNGNYGDAIYWLNRYVQANKEDTKNQYILGLAYQKDYRYQKSLEHLHIALGQVYDKSLIAKVYEQKAVTYAMYGDFMSFRDSIATQAPEMYKLAHENYLASFELVPANFEMYRTLGRFYEDKLKDKRMALYYYQKYYDEHESNKIYEHDLIWVQSKITMLTEELHFSGE